MSRTYRDVLVDLVNEECWIAGAELGVYRGDTLFYLVDHCPQLWMLGVDRWERGPAGVIKDRTTGVVSYDKPMAEHYQHVVQETVKRDGRVSIMREDTADAAQHVHNYWFDFVFIDGDHQTASVVRDIEAWQLKVRSGGALLGHDADWPSVRQALSEALGTWELLEDNLWMARQ